MWYTFQHPKIKEWFGVGKFWGTETNSCGGTNIILSVPRRINNNLQWTLESYPEKELKRVKRAKTS